MTPRTWIGAAGLTAVLALSALPAQAREMTVVAFGGASQDALRKVYFEPYIEATGNKIVEDTYNGSLAKIQTMIQTNNIIWDVVDFSGSGMARGCESGLIEEFDWSLLDRSKYLPGTTSDCGVAISTWAMVLAYNPKSVPEAPASWADFFDVNKFPGKRGLRRVPRTTMEIALLADGVPTSDIYKVLSTPEGVNRAFAKLDSIKEHIQWWKAGAQPPEWLAAGDVVMSAAYNGRITTANEAGANLTMIWDGQITHWTWWGIVRGSPNKEEGMKMIAFMNNPDLMVKLPAEIPYGLPRPDVSANVDPSLAADLPTNPAHMTNALTADDKFWLHNQDDLSARFNAWLAQ